MNIRINSGMILEIMDKFWNDSGNILTFSINRLESQIVAMELAR